MQEIHKFDKNFSQETRELLFRGFGNAKFFSPPPLFKPSRLPTQWQFASDGIFMKYT